jgi:16S rRNA (uracil1498-N3)-methyltransferase
MHRFFVPPALLAGDDVRLDGDVVQHLAVVLRLPAGSEVLLLDGCGGVCRCLLLTVGKRAVTARVLERWRETETLLPLRLLQGVPKGERMDLVLQKGTELGVGVFTPVLSERSVPRLDGARGAQRQERWQRIVNEATRQCRRPVLPSVGVPVVLAEALSTCNEALRLMLWEEESRPLAAVLPNETPADVALLVGPEGGFSATEAKQAKDNGFVAVGLGPRILRSETAGFAVAAILQHRYGDLGR